MTSETSGVPSNDGTAAPVGLIVVQIDGLSRPELDRLLGAGRLPALVGLIRDGRLAVGDWRPLLPPCTPASQAGILYGNNDGIPGFRWFEKGSRRLLVANHAGDAAEIDRRLSDGAGLLADGGVSIGNLLTGDASFSHLTMATIERALDDAAAAPAGHVGAQHRRRDRHVRDAVRFTRNPRIWARIAVDSFRELGAEIRGAHAQRAADVRPRMRRGWRYAIERVLTNVPLRILSTELVRAEIRRGRRLIYVDFTGYDEIAHHCGPGRPDAWRAAERIDRSIGRIVAEMDRAPGRYELVVLSDHGQSLGETYRQRFGRTLEEQIGAIIDGQGSYHGATDQSEYDEGLVRLAHHLLGNRVASALAGLLERRPGTNHHRPSRILDSRGAPLAAPADAQVADVVVCASGNLGLIYLTSLPGRPDRDAIEHRYPGLIGALIADPGIDVIVCRIAGGLVAMDEWGCRFLDDGRIEGRDPLAPYGPLAADGLRRIAGFPGGGDLIAIGHYDAETEQVLSFEELVGSHGGLGGPQEQPFLAAPPGWPRIEPSPIGAPNVHRQLRAWVDALPKPAGPASGSRDGPTLSGASARAPGAPPAAS